MNTCNTKYFLRLLEKIIQITWFEFEAFSSMDRMLKVYSWQGLWGLIVECLLKKKPGHFSVFSLKQNHIILIKTCIECSSVDICFFFLFLYFLFFIKGQPLQFVVTVLSHHQTSNSTDRLPYYHLTPETLNNVTVVIGTPKNLVKVADQALNTQENNPRHPKCSIIELG